MSRRSSVFGVLAIALLAVLAVVALLAMPGDDETDSASGPTPRPFEQVFRPADCETDCPQVTVDALVFEDRPALDRALRRRLITLGGWAAESDPVADIETYRGYADRLFALDAAARGDPPGRPPYEAMLSAKRIDRRAGVSVFELESDVFTGGAHGLPLTAYWQIEDKSGRVLELGDLLVDGGREALEARLRRAHARWRAEQTEDLSDWPFVMTDNVALRSDGLQASWQVYEIAPYSHGQPTLTIPYAELRGILAPRYLPGDEAEAPAV